MAENNKHIVPDNVEIDEILSVTAGEVDGKAALVLTVRAGGLLAPQSISVSPLMARRLINDMNHLLKKSPTVTAAERQPGYDTSTLLPPHWFGAGLTDEPPPYPKKGGRGRKKR